MAGIAPKENVWPHHPCAGAEVPDGDTRSGMISLRICGPPTAPPNGPIRDALEDANIAVSLLIGVEYTASGVQPETAEQARDRLKTLLEEKLPLL